VTFTTPVPGRLLLLFAFIGSTSPLAVDLYLASFPAIQEDLRTTPGMVQLTLTAYLVGVSVGQPLWGPVSERLGRRPTLLASSAATVVASLAVVLAPSAGTLVAARFVQALAAAAGIVVARAMIADLARGYDGLRALATMMTIHGLVPVVAPALGGLLATFLPWRGVLGVLAGVVVLQLLAALLWVPETLPAARRSRRVEYGDLLRVARRPAYLTPALTLGLAVATMMAFVACSPFVYQGLLGFPPLVYGLAFTLNALGMTAGGLVSARLARRHVHPARTVARALPVLVGATLLVVAAGLSPRPVLLVAPMLLTAFCCNLVMGNCMGLAMEEAHDLPGAGSAMLGLFMFGVSAGVTPLAALLGDVRSAVPMGLLMTGTALAAGAVFTLGRLLAPGRSDGFAATAAGPAGDPDHAAPLTLSAKV
jgi:DHA1 family bicyclomycin/chloramphenicol resistance-like MFS transporter